MKKLFQITLFVLFCLPAVSVLAADPGDKPVKNIVLVHGAFADGSGFQKLFKILTAKGYHVTVVQNPLTSLKDDVDATTRILDKQDGPTVLVGHSWAGTVITEAGVHPKVASLVYIAAFQPDAGENSAQQSEGAPKMEGSGILPPDEHGILYFDTKQFHKGFAADLSKEEADFMAASQGPIYAACFGTPVTHAAWKTKPAYAVLSTEDHALSPWVQRKMYERAGDKITEIKASHAVFISHPEEVAKVIIAASLQK
ncbi:Pimeloyl-ACP methyl ester carboxylesterase [Chitinophaga jiangningensis]|uniref:Pimeloyl-ACP methyl ester carboxylesterase n=1 Tax=Chitinophaga jiangningensis TaxID=1419482 RepID=A0A1M7C668_9BACT|nr:alpha/beta hydrolase [Chitinophaga jiangningensis]SHL62359.1 Pimeloyl-ACP methyl ester carboxylesterase [Chitinophaga jiangningensis]